MKTRFLTLLTVCGLLCFAANPVSAAAGRPNILVILSDDMGFSDLGCYGGEIRTPTLDALAAGGLRFTQFYNTARCCPTRASLITGLYPHQAGMGHMTSTRSTLPGYQGDLCRDTPTIAEQLKPAGYATYMCGKWHVTQHERKPGDPNYNWPLQRGFDRFYGTITGGGNFYDPTTLCRGNKFITPENDTEYRPKKFYYTDAISDNAVKFLQEHAARRASQPFFFYVAYTAAHWPMHALPEDIAKYRDRYDGGYEPARAARFARTKQLGLVNANWQMTPQAEDWAAVKDKAWETRCMEVYAAMVDRMDQGIGRIVAELKRQGQFDNTLIFFLQDNGGCAEGTGRQSNAGQIKTTNYKPFGPDDLQPQIVPPMQTRDGRPVRTGPGVMPGPEDTYIAYGRGWANVSNTPFREYKHWVHEGGISTPLIAHWPAGIAESQRNQLVHTPGHLIDIAATCADLAGRAGSTPLEGVSLRPVFEGKPITRQQPLFWEHERNRAIRDGKWKLVAKGADGPWELYDMEADRTEMHDLAAAQPDRVKEMAVKWEAWAKRAHVVPYSEGKKPRAKKAAAGAPGRWPAAKANVWLDKRGWLLGCNYAPSTAINQLEMFQADTFDLATNDRELGWAASLGFNSVRVFLHHLLWEQDPKGFLDRLDKFLAVADKHGIGVMFVLFDSCWDPFPKLGKQREPKPGLHNSGWVQTPGADVLKAPARHNVLRDYVVGVVSRFRDDRRVQVWDVWNEPNNTNDNSYGAQEPKDKAGLVRPLLTKAFAWAREAKPTQPLTSGVWQGHWADAGKLRPMEVIQIENSDVISFHNYGKLDELKQCVENLRRYSRPILCTEYMSRGNDSFFEPHLGFMKEQGVAAYNWGLVSGKTQTIYPWDSWKKAYAGEPPLWFHDIFRPDGKPYRMEEAAYIRKLTGKN
ncbi:MAG: sulfatase-like hydrolase/transferase [Verrucomicrobiia bacterium]|jgi:arylsulfatase